MGVTTLIVLVGFAVTLSVLAILWFALRMSGHEIVSRDVAVARLLTEKRQQEFEVERERAQMSAELERSALHDRLTGLLNRSGFIDQLDCSLSGTGREEGAPVPVTVLALDISRFAAFNETLGTERADSLLVKVAERVTGVLRPGDILARIDGDVFAAILETVPHQLAGEVAQRVLRATKAPYELDGEEITLSFACGLATAMPDESIDPVELVRRTEIAVQSAKSGRRAYVAFEPSIEEETQHRRRFDEDLRCALPSQELHLVYQPLVDTRTGVVSAVEALMRWQHPQRGAVSPAEFIPVAESTGQIVDMGLWALSEACRQQRIWREKFSADVVMAVNFSARQLSEPDVVERVRSIVMREAVDPRRIKLEITESLLMQDMQMAVEVLTKLRGLGLKLSIDDFGTGYSSLSRLGELPIDEIKIDRSFVDGIGERGTRETILTAAIAMGHGLGLTVVAEGVETAEQLAYLRAHNCDFSQGFLISRPVRPDDALPMLAVPWEPPTPVEVPKQRDDDTETDPGTALIVPSVLPSLEPRPTRRLMAR